MKDYVMWSTLIKYKTCDKRVKILLTEVVLNFSQTVTK